MNVYLQFTLQTTPVQTLFHMTHLLILILTMKTLVGLFCWDSAFILRCKLHPALTCEPREALGSSLDEALPCCKKSHS